MDPSLITHLAPKSPVAEAYRATRTNIEFSGVDREIRTLLVTSTTKAEGKSTTIGNLAITFAQLGRRVLLEKTLPYYIPVKSPHGCQAPRNSRRRATVQLKLEKVRHNGIPAGLMKLIDTMIAAV